MFRSFFNLLGRLTLFSTLFCSLHLYAQNAATDSFQLKINQYNLLNPTQVLFIQTDKIIYTNNETIWFAGYILQDVKGQNVQADILSVSLVQVDTKHIALQKYYLLKDFLCSGSLLLPDSIAPGNYELVASTNLVNKKGNSLGLFRQELTIKSVKAQTFNSTFVVVDTLPEAEHNLRVDVSALLTDASPLANALVKYNLNGEEPKVLKLDTYGRGTISISKAQLNLSNNVLFTSTQYKETTQYFNLQLPQSQKEDSIKVKFYPEGGFLIQGLKSRIAMEAKTVSGNVVQLKGLLLEDGRVIDTLNTSDYGLGIFSLLPKANSSYVLRLLNSDRNVLSSEFVLPTALNSGIVLQTNDAVTNDTLQVLLKNLSNTQVRIVISNTNTGYVSEPITIDKERKIKLPLNDVPKGVNTVTVFDLSNRPLAERLFFAHFDRRNNAIIETDKSEYKTREKVNVGIQLTDVNKKPIAGIFTIACVQTNRINYTKQKDIASYYYLEQLFDNLPSYSLRKAYEDKTILENLLLLQGWRRYTWQDVMQTKETDTLPPIKKLELSGQVYKFNKTLKKPVELIMKSDSTFTTLNTGANGYFSLNAKDIAVPENRSVFVMVAGKNNKGYEIVTQDPVTQVVQAQITDLPFTVLKEYPAHQDSKQFLLNDSSVKIHVLQEVVVQAKQKLYHTKLLSEMGPNACGDYLCKGYVLNCPLHFPMYKPIKGRKYYTYTHGIVPYQGCWVEEQQLMFNINKIYTARDFYGMDSVLLQQSAPEYMSTIFWKPFNIISEKEPFDSSFYTSDLPGLFKITIQGISKDGDVIFKEKEIRIRN